MILLRLERNCRDAFGFEVDNYAQYSHVIRMLTREKRCFVINFFIYQHYFMDSFYFFSALSLPIVSSCRTDCQYDAIVTCYDR